MNTKMIVTGDMTQIDLPSSQRSGLVEATSILKGVGGYRFYRDEQKRHRAPQTGNPHRGSLRKEHDKKR